MPKRKDLRKSESKRTDWRSRKTGKYDIESPERMQAQSLEMKQAISLERMPAQSPEMKQATSPERSLALNKDQRTNGPVNAHLIFWPSKAQNIQNLEIYGKEMTLTFNTHIPS